MVVGFCFIGGLFYSEWWVWDLRILAQFQGSEMSPRLFQEFMDGYYKTLPISGWIWLWQWLWVRVPNQCNARLNPMGSQFSIPILWNLCSESVGDIKFWDPVEGSDTSHPSSITVRMEYLFAFQFWCCEFCVKNFLF